MMKRINIKVKRIVVGASSLIIFFLSFVYFDTEFVPENKTLLPLKLRLCDIVSDMKNCPLECRSLFCTDMYFSAVLNKGDDFIKKEYVKEYKCFNKSEAREEFKEDSPPYYFINSRKKAAKVCISWDFKEQKATGILFLENEKGKIVEVSDWYSLH